MHKTNDHHALPIHAALAPMLNQAAQMVLASIVPKSLDTTRIPRIVHSITFACSAVHYLRAVLGV